ncbi:hypothetical protein CP061683_0309A, partial [Chlamydia psittaci 06-1683]|jgi:hypothetical protein
MVCQ